MVSTAKWVWRSPFLEPMLPEAEVAPLRSTASSVSYGIYGLVRAPEIGVTSVAATQRAAAE